MISSGGMAGSQMSMGPKPASSAMGVKLSLLCAAAARAQAIAKSTAKDLRIRILFFIQLLFCRIRRKGKPVGCFEDQGSMLHGSRC